ncbi:amino acid adenylation domain-containing protein [Aquimarina sp. MAR_2010_214]|uniref:non-ribosomal peptide synthetase n=1 Tax=Aquimarina sp. MAR_2010_214 TaxID=1250026 RepID=UPI000C702DDF|nr:non-ribosomal peptide synthetase [Aquimarina sp. MAR_2010_214]PKV49527.1 amino acid adenylation domain-containing protein [Aquimarina sp. MAR_2010_214]
MNIIDLVGELNDRKINVTLDGNDLQLSFDDEYIDEQIIEKIRSHKAELVAHLRKYSVSKHALSAIKPLATARNYDISDAQRRLWVLSQFDDGLLAYNLPSIIDLKGSYDIPNFKRAIDAVIDRHEILRTVFKEDETGELKQWVLSREALAFSVCDKDFRNCENQQGEVDVYVEQDSFQPFDLEQGPLIRASLLQVADNQYVFYCNMHHIISDGWSMKVLVQDVLTYYEAFKQGRTLILPGLEIQYKDYAAWQLGMLQENQSNNHKAYWTERLQGELPQFDLLGKQQRPKIKTYQGKTLETILTKEQTSQFKAFGQQQGGSLFMTLLAIWKVLLHRYTGQNDMIIGSPVAGRNHPDLENQIGFYVNTLALRSRIDPEQTFIEFYSDVRSSVLEAFEHQVYPFDRLVNDLDLKRDTSRNAIFDVMIILQNAGEQVQGFTPDSTLLNGIFDHGKSMSRFDIEITHEELGEYLSIKVNYNTDLYEQETIVSLIGHFQSIAQQVLMNNSQIGNISYLSQSERVQLLKGFNDTAVDYSKVSVIELFEDQVKKTPNAIAVCCSEKQMTYRELDEMSNQYAHCLKEHLCIIPLDNIGVMLERSALSIVPILGILKSGACYVPIDPTYPEARIQYILKDAHIQHVLTQTNLMEKHDIPKQKLWDITKMDFSTYSRDNLLPVNTSGDDAFIIYTSGSTGQPKGVRQTHRMLTNLVQWDIEQSGIRPGTRYLQYVSFSFDVSMLDVFFNLCAGGELYISNEQERTDHLLLKNVIIKRKLQVLSFPFAAMNNFFNQLELKDFDGHSIEHIITAGEQLYLSSPLSTFLETNPEVVLHNHYGPSETHVVTSHSMSAKQGNLEKRAPIGRAISNTDIYILDTRLQPVPLGAKGELYIGGDNLANGFLNLPEETDKRFVSHPFKEGERVYKTGDLAYYRPDGIIEYLGRKDDQVKVRGFRIELGEIEHALLQYEAVYEAVVLVKDQNLLAYVIHKAEGNSDELRSFLKQRLPEYMLPYYYVSLKEFPLTSNGKVDKKALLEIGDTGFESSAAYVAPQSKQERKVVEIWEKILQKEKVGVNDDFFELGGHSLNATKLIAAYHKAFGVKLRLQDIFTHSTLCAQVSLIKSSKEIAFEEIPNAQPQENYPLSEAQRMIWVKSQFVEGSRSYVMPTVRELKGNYNIDILKKALFALIDRHEVLRTVFKKNEIGEVRQYVLSPEEFSFEFDLIDIQEEEDPEGYIKQYVFEKDYLNQFNLKTGPLFRAGFFKKAKNSYVFYFTFHHIVTDAWSVNIMTRDLMALYNQIKQGEPSSLPVLRIQYKDYATWQQSELLKTENKVHENYWLKKFSGDLSRITLPFQKKRPKIKTHNGRYLSCYLSESLTEKMDAFSLAQEGSSYMTLLAVWNILFYKYTAQEDIIIASPIAGREHVDLHDQIGCFINTLVMRPYLDSEKTFSEFYDKVKSETLDAYAHQKYPFELIVEKLDTKRELDRNPVFDIMLADQKVGHLFSGDAFENKKLTESELENIEDLGMRYAKFDLELHFYRVQASTNFRLKYNTDLFDRKNIESMVNRFKFLLAEVLDNPDQKIKNISVITTSEREKILGKFNKASEVIKDDNIVSLFRQQVMKNPNKIAIECDGNEISYIELDKLTNQLANYMVHNHDIGINDIVGVSLPRSEWSVISMLSILKAGGAYLPIDINYPETRINYIINNSQCKVCIDAEVLKCFHQAKDGLPKTAPDICLEGDNLAYVIYTSGSTGKPKGVLVPHRGVVRLSKMENLPLDANTTILQLSSVSFDAATFEIWCSLLNGGQLVMYPEQFVDLKTVNQIIQTKMVNTIWLTAALFDQWVNSGIANLPLRYILSGGDVLRPQSVARVYEQLPKACVINGYGPTENTTFTCCYEVPRDHDFSTNIPIGKPILGTQVYVLDAQDRLCPVGIVGELCTTGLGLSHGYLNQPELTQTKFIIHPLAAPEVGKLYKTGDLAKWLPDGTLEFVGRVDDQVKIRGHRIELGEIEKAVTMYSKAIQQVVVRPTEFNDEKLLVTYFTARDFEDKEGLKDYLTKTLPKYMVPSFYIALDEVPITSNGKIDVDALPSVQEKDMIKKEYIAPKNEMEVQVLQAWREVLGIEDISVTDNFFDIGGSSIAITRLYDKISTMTAQPPKMASLFAYNTIRMQSEYLQKEVQPSQETMEINEIDF